MNMAEFCLLTGEKQIEEVYKDGVYIGKLENDEQIRMLYQLNSFYVEILFLSYRKFISEIKCYSNLDKILRYLEQVEIENDIKCMEK